MDWMMPIYPLIAVALVLLNGFFVLVEFALVKVRATRIEELARAGDGRAVVARKMVVDLDSYLSATQLGITVASLGLGWVGEPAFSGMIETVVGLPDWWSDEMSRLIAATLSFFVITFLHILIGEQAPKMLAIRRAEECALAVAHPMRWVYRMFYLPMILLNGACKLILRLMGLEAGTPVVHTEQELRTLLATAQTTGGFTLNRLLMLENIFDLGHQTVHDAMVPWSRVQTLSRTATRAEVVRLLAEHRFSRYPVVDPATALPVGYLLTKDLIVLPPDEGDWTALIRPLGAVAPSDKLEATMAQLQAVGSNMALVMDGARLVGLIALEDILEEVVGRMEDEFPRLPRLFLKDTLTAGGVVLDLQASTPEEAIRSLAEAIPVQHLPEGVDVTALALERERQMTTDVGQGVAIPHARCPGLANPLLVFGRPVEGITFSEESTTPVQLIFLLVTPAERPNLQVFLLAQLASVAQSELVRERLCRAATPQEIIDIIAAADPAITG